MSDSQKTFKINPIELVIFLVVTLVFCNSVYNLFYDWGGVKTSQIQPQTPEAAERSVASHSTFENRELNCNPEKPIQTQAEKIRLSGPLCGSQEGQPLVKTEIVNLANKAEATVFADTQTSKFSTDYVPLNSGENPFSIRFHYNGGRVVSTQVLVKRD